MTIKAYVDDKPVKVEQTFMEDMRENDIAVILPFCAHKDYEGLIVKRIGSTVFSLSNDTTWVNVYDQRKGNPVRILKPGQRVVLEIQS